MSFAQELVSTSLLYFRGCIILNRSCLFVHEEIITYRMYQCEDVVLDTIGARHSAATTSGVVRIHPPSLLKSVHIIVHGVIF